MKGYSVFAKAPALLGQQDTRWGSLTLLQRFSWCILQLLPTGPPGHSLGESCSSAEIQLVYFTALADWATRTLIWRVLLFWRDSVGVFYSSCRLGHHDTRWGSLTLLQRFSWCILQLLPTGPPGHSLGESWPSAEIQLVYFTALADLASRTLVGGVLAFCRDSVGVFYRSCRLGQQDTRWGSLTLLQRFSWCILQLLPTGPPGHSLGESYSSAEIQLVYFTPLPTGPAGHSLGESYSSAEIQLVYFTALADWGTRTLVGGVLLFCRDSVGVFYSSCRLGPKKKRK